MILKEALEKSKNIIYEYISIPSSIIEMYSKNVFDKKPKMYHITTWYKPEYTSERHYGEKIKFKVIAYGKSDIAEAVKIQFLNKPEWLHCKDNLHITLSFKNKPVDSNYIENWTQVRDGTIYEGEFNGFSN